MVATDSYRLSVKETKLDAPLKGAFEANVPARALQELTRIVQSTESETLSVSVRTNQVIFEAAASALVAPDRRPFPQHLHRSPTLRPLARWRGRRP